MAEATGIVASEFHRLTLLSSFILLLILLMRRNLLTVSVGAASLCALLLVDLGYVHGKAVRHDNAIYQTMDRIKQSLDDSLGQDKTPYRVGALKTAWGQSGDGLGLSDGRRLYRSFPEPILRVHERVL